MADHIIEIKTKDWLWFYNLSEVKSRIEFNAKQQLLHNGGKYLFFSPKRDLLINLAKKILQAHNLFCAKVPAENAADHLGDFVLCIYDVIPTLKSELNIYSTSEIRYRYWKSNADTQNGVYSSMWKQGVEVGG